MRVLVHFHLYYFEQLDYFLDKMANIVVPEWHLVVTWSAPNEEARHKLLDFKKDTEFEEVENVGYDVWPFMKLMNSGRYDDYDYVIKLHTKAARRKIGWGGKRMTYKWRDNLVEPLIGSRENFERLDSIFASEPQTGMVCSVKHYGTSGYKEDFCVEDELARMGFSHITERHFCGGTMFAARISAIKLPVSYSLSSNDFSKQSFTDDGGTMAHIYERVYSILPVAYGYRVHTVGSDFFFVLKNAYRHSLGIIVKWVLCLEREQLTKRKFLRVFGIKFFLES